MVKKGIGADSSHIKGLGWCAVGYGSNTGVVDVKDGKILRTRNFDWTEAYSHEELNAWKINARGKTLEGPLHSVLPPFSIAYKKRATSKNRIPYPMLRVDWSPEDRNPQNRGKSKFERISWDEALDIITSEIRRQYDTYGPGSILCMGDGHGETKTIQTTHACMMVLLDYVMGGCTISARQADSWEGWFWGAEHIWDGFPTGQGYQANLLYDICHNTDLLLCWGCDQETTPWGWGGLWASIMSYHFTDLGIQQIYICPDVNYAVAVHADKWIPVLPNTDLALQFAIAYVWLTEGTYDREYLDTHTVGFDWLEYEIMGGESGVPRTPEWAEEICGVPARTIKSLARRWAQQTTTIAHCNGGSYIRSCFSHEPARMEVCLLAMQGLGKPGANQFKFFEWGLLGTQTTKAMPLEECDLPVFAAFNGDLIRRYPRFIPKTLIPDGIMTTDVLEWKSIPCVSMPKEVQFEDHRFPAKDGDPTLHMIWADSPCWTTCWNGGNKLVDAMRNPNMEFIMAQHPWFENDCLFCDLLLPVSTKYEQLDVNNELSQGTPNTLFIETKAIEPVGEAKGDWDIVRAVAERLGVLDEYITDAQGNYRKDDETCVKLCFDSTEASRYISWEKFQEQGFVAVPFHEKWEEVSPGFYDFYKDPEKNPLLTQSGKLEIYSKALAANFPDDKERMPYPHYIEESDYHQESRRGERGMKYPFLLVSNHPRWRVHAQFDDIPWLRELSKQMGEDGYAYEPLWINPVDAMPLGIKTGDVLKIFNERGWVLGGAVVTERIRPGAVSQDHGARLDPIEGGISDRGGANNLIAPSHTTSKNCPGEVTSGYLVGVEKADLNALKNEYPETFNRSYDPAEGVKIENWIEG
jgi:trimethylamine-N-oxide reductase (cytochrome c)